MSLSRGLYRAARIARNAEALGSGNPRKASRRAANVLVGRGLARRGFWNRLWGGGRR